MNVKIEKAKIDLSSLDEDGRSEKYNNFDSYFIVCEKGEIPRIGILDHFFDEKNEHSSFDNKNYSKFIKACLKEGDECYIEDLYIISNKK
jgi:hypothetical protein